MYSLILHGRRFFELQKWRHLRVSVNLFQNETAFSNSYSSASAPADVRPRDGRKEKTFTVSYLVDSLCLTAKLAESISRNVNFMDKGNPDSVLSLFKSHGFTDSQISSIIADYPQLLIADAEKSLGPKLQFLHSRGASVSELTEIVSTVPKLLAKKKGKCMSRYYDIVKEIIEADKSSKYEKLSPSLPECGKQENKIRNVLVLREMGVPQKLLFSMLISNRYVCGREKFQESLKKVIEMGFDPTTKKFVRALRIIHGWKDKTTEKKVIVVYKRLGFDVEDVWDIFKKCPTFLAFSEKKIANSIETYLSLGFSRDEFAMMIKCYPECIGYSAETVKNKTEFLVKKMNWPLKALVSRPNVLSYSMEKRIVPRCNVIKALMSKGLLGEDGRSELPKMSSVLVCTDHGFLKRYVRRQDNAKELVAELMAIFFTRDCNFNLD